MNDFSNISYVQKVDFWIETLVEEIKPLVTEKNGYEYRDIITNRTFQNFRTTRILMQG